jgi:hypothetical protein
VFLVLNTMLIAAETTLLFFCVRVALSSCCSGLVVLKLMDDKKEQPYLYVFVIDDSSTCNSVTLDVCAEAGSTFAVVKCSLYAAVAALMTFGDSLVCRCG